MQSVDIAVRTKDFITDVSLPQQALILLLALLGFVLGLPLAIVFLILKGIAFLLRTILLVPALQPLMPIFKLFGI